jgi:Carboxypeptidase regulatory-like domain
LLLTRTARRFPAVQLRRIVALAFACLTAGTSAAAQDAPVHVTGTVTDTARHPVPYVNVLVGGTRRTVADDAGQFRLELPVGRVVIDFRRLGYRPEQMTLDLHGDTTVTVSLIPVAQKLPGQEVTTPRSFALELHGFYERMADHEKGIGAGHFITAEDIERRNPRKLTQMLEEIPSLRILRVPAKPGDMCPLGYCLAPTGTNHCPMGVYLDGQRLNRLTSANPSADYVADLDDFIIPTHVAGMEVYAHPGEVPPQYQLLNGNCGVILIWTK